MNINGNNFNKPLINDAWSENSTKKINISRRSTIKLALNVVIIYIIMLAGAALSVRTKGGFISTGLFDRVQDFKKTNYNMYNSQWTAFALIALALIGFSLLIMVLRYNRMVGVIDIMGIFPPVIAGVILIIGAVINCGGGADYVSYNGVTVCTKNEVTVGAGFVFVLIFIGVYVWQCILNMRERTQLANEEKWATEKDSAGQKIEKETVNNSSKTDPKYRTADDFFKENKS